MAGTVRHPEFTECRLLRSRARKCSELGAADKGPKVAYAPSDNPWIPLLRFALRGHAA